MCLCLCVYGMYACVCVCVCVCICSQLLITVFFYKDICYLFVFIGNSRSMLKHGRLVIRQSYVLVKRIERQLNANG